jgi:hypothetical protein
MDQSQSLVDVRKSQQQKSTSLEGARHDKGRRERYRTTLPRRYGQKGRHGVTLDYMNKEDDMRRGRRETGIGGIAEIVGLGSKEFFVFIFVFGPMFLVSEFVFDGSTCASSVSFAVNKRHFRRHR